MKQHRLSAKKRLAKPILFGTLLLGLATAFFNRRLFLKDVEDMKAEHRAMSSAKSIEVLEMRRRLMEQYEEKRKSGSS